MLTSRNEKFIELFSYFTVTLAGWLMVFGLVTWYKHPYFTSSYYNPNSRDCPPYFLLPFDQQLSVKTTKYSLHQGLDCVNGNFTFTDLTRIINQLEQLPETIQTPKFIQESLQDFSKSSEFQKAKLYYDYLKTQNKLEIRKRIMLYEFEQNMELFRLLIAMFLMISMAQIYHSYVSDDDVHNEKNYESDYQSKNR